VNVASTRTPESRNTQMIDRFRRARTDPALVVLEGFHALKHAIRFRAEILEVVATQPAEMVALASELAPDLAVLLPGLAETITTGLLASLGPQVPRTGVMAIARRPSVDLPNVLARNLKSPIVLLEDPRNMGNLGACVRVAAAAGAAGVVSTGDNDPWHPDAVRGAAGLHFALPVAHAQRLPPSDRPLVAIDPDGQDLRPSDLPPAAILAFGTERHGLSDELLAVADARLRIPMTEGVSSLNLATSVSAVLYSWRLASEPRGASGQWPSSVG
jgi:TrmH family RNA methyltransferase